MVAPWAITISRFCFQNSYPRFSRCFCLQCIPPTRAPPYTAAEGIHPSSCSPTARRRQKEEEETIHQAKEETPCVRYARNLDTRWLEIKVKKCRIYMYLSWHFVTVRRRFPLRSWDVTRLITTAPWPISDVFVLNAARVFSWRSILNATIAVNAAWRTALRVRKNPIN